MGSQGREYEASIVFDDVKAADVRPGKEYKLTSCGHVWIRFSDEDKECKAPFLGLFRPLWLRVDTPHALEITSLKVCGREHIITRPEIPMRTERPGSVLIVSMIRGDDPVVLTVVPQVVARLRIALVGRYIEERLN